jgi:hypothetical protein
LNKKEIKANEKNFARRRALFSFTSFFSLPGRGDCNDRARRSQLIKRAAPFFSSRFLGATRSASNLHRNEFYCGNIRRLRCRILLLIMHRQTGADLMDSCVKSQRLHQRRARNFCRPLLRALSREEFNCRDLFGRVNHT